jgi:prepilin-type N-terminal cleavage/methylation domain-containing protein
MNNCSKGGYVYLYSRLRPKSGYTLLEVLIVVTIIGIFMAIALPSWLGFLERRYLVYAQERVQRAKYEAKSNARKNKLIWQVSFQENGSRLFYSIHEGSIPPVNTEWHGLGDKVQLDAENTTLFRDNNRKLWRVQYNHHGNTNGRLGRITLMGRSGGQTRRCVIASTLVGNTRLARDKKCLK